ncbi:MAG: hypothetical protein LBT74_12600 [Acidobacteriota bacterium]|nr:hypothetical protein [Acidobacteriota bacterium]
MRLRQLLGNAYHNYRLGKDGVKEEWKGELARLQLEFSPCSGWEFSIPSRRFLPAASCRPC